MDSAPDVQQKLLPQRLVQAVLDVEVVDDRGRQLPAFPVPWSARREVHEHEGDENYEEEDGDHPEQAPDDIDRQGGSPAPGYPLDEGQGAPLRRGARYCCQFLRRKCTSKFGWRCRLPSRRRVGGSLRR